MAYTPKPPRLAPPSRFWQDWQVHMLREHYADSLTSDLAQVLGKSVQSVSHKARDLGLKKSKAFIAAAARERTSRPGHGAKAFQFAKGLVPWNKGTKGLVGVQEACRATQFKPGQRPHTWVPVGSYRVTTDGVFERKFSDEPGPNNKRWKAVTRLVWEENVGPVPPGHIVVFRTGMKPDRIDDIEAYTVDRLECITRRQNMERNTYHQYGPEIASLVQLRGVLTRQINRKTKEKETA